MPQNGEVVKNCIKHGILVKWEPLIPLTPRRMVLIPPRVKQKLNDDVYSVSRGRINSAIESFMEGDMKTVGFNINCECDLKRLQPAEDEVWSIRSLTPSPSVRIFGSFIEPDTFVVTNIARRVDLKEIGSPEWNEEITNAVRAWNATFSSFGTVKPLTGVNVDDYITRNATLQSDI